MLRLKALWKSFYHFLIRMLYHPNQLVTGNSPRIKINAVPVLFILVPARFNVSVFIPVFLYQGRVHFQVAAKWLKRETCEQKHFAHYLEYQGIAVKWKLLGNAFFGQTKFPYFFNIHSTANFRTICLSSNFILKR